MNPKSISALLAAGLALASSPSTSEVDLSGTYVYLLETQTITKLPIIKDYVATTRSVSLLELRHHGKKLSGSGPICSIAIRGSSSMVRTEIPSAFLKSLPHTKLDALLTPTALGSRFTQPTQSLVVGARLQNPSSDPLPENDSDARVYDQDQDGKPGVTVRVRGIVSGEVFVAQRSTSALTGMQTSSGFAGTVDFTVEQRVLGASSPFLKGNRTGAPNPKGSFFRLMRVPSGATCSVAESKARESAAPR